MEPNDFLKEAAVATGIGIVCGVVLYVLMTMGRKAEQRRSERERRECPKLHQRYPDYDD